MAQRKQSKLAFVLEEGTKKKKKRQLCFPDLLPGGLRENAESLWKVVEAHGHADVAGEADVDAEVDQPLFAWA